MITVYSKTHCAHCDSAKQYLKNHNINYRDVNIESDPAAREFVVSHGHRTVPQIYVGDKLLVQGGWQELSKLSADEILDRVAALI